MTPPSVLTLSLSRFLFFFVSFQSHVPLRHALEEGAAVFDVHDHGKVGVAGFQLLDHKLLVRQAKLVVVLLEQEGGMREQG